MHVKCWGKFPIKGQCPNVATRFFVSQIKESKGIVPANRAVCDSCHKAYHFDHFVKHGSVIEVSSNEWRELPGQTLQERI